MPDLLADQDPETVPDPPVLCPICGRRYGRGPADPSHVGDGKCLSRVLDFLGLEFPGFALAARLDDGRPFTLVDRPSGNDLITEIASSVRHCFNDEEAEPLELAILEALVGPGISP